MARCYTCSRSFPRSRPRLRQLLLGASQNGQLCVLSPGTLLHKRHYLVSIDARQDKLVKNSPILQIPDELLEKIFTHSLETKFWGYEYYYTALILSKVSTRFYRVVQPLMYKTIHLSNHSIARPCAAVKLFHRTVTENPTLGPMVKSIRVHVEFLITASDAEFRIANELLGLLPNVELFGLHGGYEHPSTWPMIRNAVGNWPRVKDMVLSREDWSLLMAPVCELVIATPNLRTLNLHGISTSAPRNSTSHTVWTPPSKEVERTSKITNLIISDFGETPEALQSLLKLLQALEHLVFGKIHSNPVRWRLDMFQWLLVDHQKTLKSIEIGALGLGFTPINFLEFPQLEVLNLSHWVYRETPEVAAASILAPKLHTFIWDFRVIDQHSESWSDFGEEQKKWLLKFAELAAERKSALKKIEIVFHPDDYDGPRTKEELAVCVTPWDLMDEVKDIISPLGIELEYNKCWSREEYLARLEWDEEVSDALSSVNLDWSGSGDLEES